MAESFLTPELVASLVVNLVSGVGNVVQGFKASNAQQLRSTIDALTDENESLRRQLGDLRAGYAREARQDATRVGELEQHLQQGSAAWEQQRRNENEVLERGKDSFQDVVGVALAAAEVAEAKYLKKVDHLIDVARTMAATDLGLSRAEIDRISDNADRAEFEKLVIEHGRTIGLLMLLQTARAVAQQGMEYCGRMTLVFHHIMTVGMSNPTTPIRSAVRDFLEGRPLFQQKNENGELVDVCVLPTDIDRRFEEWATRRAVRERADVAEGKR
jgi:hypothetical protein